jgi:demethylmenaquinone methyltransferase/2-methoxy-6-polyprenyl-1,4-benzoquinol methylase
VGDVVSPSQTYLEGDMSDDKSLASSGRIGSEMEPALRQRMLVYYNERAADYEEAYTLGTGTSSITDPTVFTGEIAALPDIVRQFAGGRLLDLACGTAYWLPHYADAVSQVTLFDQSANMLELAGKKAKQIGIATKCTVVKADFFDYEFPDSAYDRALLGFFVSHLTEDEEARVFTVLRKVLGADGQFLILDSAWTPERAKFNQKIGRQKRRLNDGAAFEIYKRYLSREDVLAWAEKYPVGVSVEHFGSAFCAVKGRFLG